MERTLHFLSDHLFRLNDFKFIHIRVFEAGRQALRWGWLRGYIAFPVAEHYGVVLLVAALGVAAPVAFCKQHLAARALAPEAEFFSDAADYLPAHVHIVAAFGYVLVDDICELVGHGQK